MCSPLNPFDHIVPSLNNQLFLHRARMCNFLCVVDVCSLANMSFKHERPYLGTHRRRHANSVVKFFYVNTSALIAAPCAQIWGHPFWAFLRWTGIWTEITTCDNYDKSRQNSVSSRVVNIWKDTLLTAMNRKIMVLEVHQRVCVCACIILGHLETALHSGTELVWSSFAMTWLMKTFELSK